MIVVADTSPINYLVLIGHIEILPHFYGRILVPPAVWEELQDMRRLHAKGLAAEPVCDWDIGSVAQCCSRRFAGLAGGTLQVAKNEFLCRP